MGVERLTKHIEITPGVLGGKPRIAGRRVSVYHVVVLYDRLGMSADEIADEYDLSLAQIHAALAYYYDHRDEIEDRAASDAEFAKKMRAEIPSKLFRKVN